MKDEQTKKTTEKDTVEDEKNMRREFLKYAGLGAGGMALIGCANEILETSSPSQISRSTNALTDLTLDGGVYRGDSVETIEDLKGVVGGGVNTDERALLLLGYYSAGDGGGGFFYWHDDPGEDHNGGTVIQPNGYSGPGRWIRLYDGPINVRWFGASPSVGVPDNSAKNSEAIEYAIDLANSKGGGIVHIPAGTYNINATINMKDRVVLKGDGGTRQKSEIDNHKPTVINMIDDIEDDDKLPTVIEFLDDTSTKGSVRHSGVEDLSITTDIDLDQDTIGIHLYRSQYCFLTRVSIYYFRTGIKLGGPVKPDSAYWNILTACIVHGTGEQVYEEGNIGFHLQTRTCRCLFVCCQVSHMNQGVYIEGGSGNTFLSGEYVHSHTAIEAYSGGNITIIAPFMEFYSDNPDGTETALKIGSDAKWVNIINPRIISNYSNKVVNASPSTYIIYPDNTISENAQKLLFNGDIDIEGTESLGFSNFDNVRLNDVRNFRLNRGREYILQASEDELNLSIESVNSHAFAWESTGYTKAAKFYTPLIALESDVNSVSMSRANMFKTNNTTPIDITRLKNGQEGQVVTIIGADGGNTTIRHGVNNIRLNGGNDFILEDNYTLTIVKINEIWVETSRSSNL